MGFIALVLWLARETEPAIEPITAIEARAAELPQDLQHWQDLRPADWKHFELPLKVCRVKCTTPYTAWRYHFAGNATPLKDPALFFPFSDANMALYLNGTLIEMQGRMQAPPSVYRYMGRLIRLPAPLLRPDHNELVWLLTIERRGIGGVAPFFLGEYGDFEKPLARLRWLTHDLIAASFWLQLATMMFALGMLWRGSQERVVIWFLLAAPFWLVLAAWHLAPDWGGLQVVRFAVFQISLFGILSFSPVFVTAILEAPPLWLVRTAGIYFLSGALLTLGATLWPGLDDYWRIAPPHYAIKWTALLILPFAVFRLYRYLDRTRDSRMAQWTLAAALLPAVCGTHDVIRGSLEMMIYALTPVSGFGISLAFCLELGRRVLANQQRMKQYTNELARKINEREQELAKSYARIQRVDRERALADERQRIMQDMHDGVAGQLSALVYLANDPGIGRGAIIEAVRAGLLDMRLVLDSLNQHDGDLALALGSLRGRIDPLLNATGTSLRWTIEPDLDLQGFNPDQLLGILRILQEAIVNSVKHARSNLIEFHAIRIQRGCLFAVKDNGCGFIAQAAATNRYGQSGMRSRAEKLGGRLDIDAAPGCGTIVALEIDLPQVDRAQNLLA